MDPLGAGYYRKNFAYGGYFERYVWLSFETIRKMEVGGYAEEDGRGGFFDDNDTRWFLKHEITKDEKEKEVIESSEGEDEWPPV